MKASVLILTFNEEQNLPRCLESLERFDDIVVLDSGSTDATCDLAEKAGVRVIRNPFVDFASQRNFGLENYAFCHEWILHLDADEALTDEFVDALELLEPPDDVDGYRVPSKTMMNGKWLRRAGMYPSYQVRLGHRERLRFVQVGHGQRESSPPEKISTFPEPYLHFNFSNGLRNWFNKHIRYAEDEAKVLLEERNQSVQYSNLFSKDPTQRRRAYKSLSNFAPLFLRPAMRFGYILIVRLGILDGWVGVQYALMLAGYECMIASFALQIRQRENVPTRS